tara:strand:+ start:1688 stop:2263 length:576 start_codon:yes stop_codon:yes gene_type:complete
LAKNLEVNHDPIILVFGDSVSSAHGMPDDQGWVSLLNQKLIENNNDYRLINTSVSGETTTGGLARLPQILQTYKPSIVILELGGNDGLRGYPVSQIRENLQKMIELCKRENIEVLLIGMVLPYNYGIRYRTAFENAFSELAESNDVQFLPFLLDGASTPIDLIQEDRIHPRPEAQPIILDQIWQHLANLLM